MNEQVRLRSGRHKDERKSEIRASFRAAFSGWWSVFGTFAASITGFNLARRFFNTELAGVLAEAVRIYETVVHGPLLFLFSSLDGPRPPRWAIDAVVLWLLGGGLILRSVLALRRDAYQVSISIAPPEAREAVIKEWRLPQFPMQRLMEWRGSRIMWRVSFVLSVAAYLLLWPWLLRTMLKSPRLYRVRDWRYQLDFVVTSARCIRNKEYDRGSLIRESKFLYDMRTILVVQALAAVFLVTVWFALNALLHLYWPLQV